MNRLVHEAKTFVAVLRDGPKLFLLAPLIPLIVMVPEFVQHLAEIRLGMFTSLDVFKALSYDNTRMTFGVIKIAGVYASLLLAARFWSNRAAGRSSLSFSGLSWHSVGIAFGANLLVSFVTFVLMRLVPAAGSGPAQIVVGIATLPLLVYLVGALLEDPEAGLVHAYRHGWLQALRIVLFAGIPFAILQAAHYEDHMLAIGQPQPAVWALMVWDTLVVGLMMVLAGTGLHHGYFGSER